MKPIKCILIALIVVFFAKSYAVSNDFSTAPPNSIPEKKRIAYYEGGEYRDYKKVLIATIYSLMKLGWIDEIEVPDNPNQTTAQLWEWLSKQEISKYIDFPESAFYSSNWDEKLREDNKQSLIKRLNKQGDIDLVFAMGTWAGLDLANDKHSTPTIVMTSSDPISAGIISSPNDSGYDHLMVQVDPEQHARQIKLYHELIGFTKLGVAFENTPVGRSYAAIDTIYASAEERGFEVVPCYTKSDIPDRNLAVSSLIECYQYLADKVNSFYVPEQGGIGYASIKKIVSIANQHKISSFSQYGYDDVKYGYLLSLSRPLGHLKEGQFLAERVSEILNGAKPRDLNQIFEDNPDIYLNMKTAEIIGFHLNAYLLAAADKLYWRIED